MILSKILINLKNWQYMNHKDFKNIKYIKRILKYIDKGKFDIKAWSNA